MMNEVTKLNKDLTKLIDKNKVKDLVIFFNDDSNKKYIIPAFKYAAEKENIRIIKEVFIPLCKRGVTGFHILLPVAVEAKNITIFTLLLENISDTKYLEYLDNLLLFIVSTFVRDENINKNIVKNIQMIELILKKGINPTNTFIKSFKIICMFDKVVDLFIRYGSDINQTDDKSGDTPLIIASRLGKFNIVKLLLDSGANKYVKNNEGYTALRTAIADNQYKIVELLLDDKNIEEILKTDEGLTPLLLASELGRKQIVELLIKRGANTKAKNARGKDALILATESKNAEIVDLLLKEIDPNFSKDDNGNTPLIIACDSNDYNSAKKLLENGANVNAKNKKGGTPLIKASVYADPELIALLLKYGADIEGMLEDDGKFEIAWENIIKAHNGIDAFKLFLEKGLNIEAEVYSYTPLLVACEYLNLPIVQFLLEKGANVQYQNCDKDTALHILFEHNEILNSDKITEGIFNLLLKYGADINVKNRFGRTLLIDIIQRDCNIIWFNLLVKNGADVMVKTKSGMSALHYASERFCIDIIKELLNAGLDVNEKDNNGNTPIMLSIIRYERYERYKEDFVKQTLALLLNNGADITIENKEGKKAIDLTTNEFIKDMVSEKHEECSICFEDLLPTNRYIEKCGHKFHKECIDGWKKSWKKSNCKHNIERSDCPIKECLDEKCPCPICKKSIDGRRKKVKSIKRKSKRRKSKRRKSKSRKRSRRRTHKRSRR